jgi:hypothetical protein
MFAYKLTFRTIFTYRPRPRVFRIQGYIFKQFEFLVIIFGHLYFGFISVICEISRRVGEGQVPGRCS